MVLVMSAQEAKQPRSGRFMRAYLMMWGLAAAIGLTYLASVAMRFEFRAPVQQEAAKPAIDPEQGLRLANRAMIRIDSVQQSVGEVQRDLGSLRAAFDQRESQDREAQSRISSLEERVTTLQTPPPAVAAAAPAAKQKVAEKNKQTAEKRTSPHVVSVGEEPRVVPPPPANTVETGSIPSSAPPITFGTPEVTPVRQNYTVQLGAGPSLDALRMAWLVLRDQHGAALGTLQPRFVAPKGGTGSYRLVAGPLPSKADADKVCAAMGVGRDACFATTAIGHPL
jgi:hypothetical protein